MGSDFCRGIKLPRPLEYNRPHLYNPVTDQIASIDVHIHVADSNDIGGKDGKEIHSKPP